MNADKIHQRSIPQTTTLLKTSNNVSINNFNLKKTNNSTTTWGSLADASFLQWTTSDVFGLFKYHPVPCFFAVSLLFFMGVEYTLRMIPPSSPPFDIGFVATAYLHRVLVASPTLNTVLAGLNTVFVGMQTTYIIGTWVIEGRPRATVAALFMFTCRGILGYSTQLPLPEGFLGSGADFPRMHRWELAFLFDTLNLLQVVRLLSTRGHYTIDLAVGVGAGMLFDSLAGKYMKKAMAEGGDVLYTNLPHLS
ncbi:phosphatidylcholine:diacylglycerol cholinephosphotransferase 1 isoform X2 [Helianthus annuus]|uniref:phosphatidylcholine:diacylglycerol cholinephosphotransferase 1 isoform X2 n=1 Tax=Helianthus annuus TaxID=4232 RepID=UPI000B8F5754|nr:phosphatidylcholine:diacylglycerol cholinephosphotransferase 1 isoform X2 [Helianthus annuus]